MKKKEFNLYVQLGISKEKDAELIIQSLINWLISILYVPDANLIKVVNRELIKKLGLDEDAINWGDLKCFEVEKEKACLPNRQEEKWIAYVDEADPTAYNLRRYLQNWLMKWGWDVEVITEW